MRVLVAGASGAVGRSLVSRLVAKGHSVVGLTHSPKNMEAIRKLNAEAFLGDGLNREAVRAAICSTQPNVIVHEMTALSAASDLRHFDRAFAMTNRLRTEGTDHFLAAAREFGVKRLIAQSFCGLPYARVGGSIKSETDPLNSEPPVEFRRTLDAIRYLEKTVTSSSQPEGIVLRYGAFYGLGTGVFESGFVHQLRHRRVPLIGDGGGWWSFVHIDDAAEATVRAIEDGEASDLYNIVDDDPAPVREWLPELARLIGAKPPFRLPVWPARLIAGEHLVIMMTQERGGSNAKAKRELGWHRRTRRGGKDLPAS